MKLKDKIDLNTIDDSILIDKNKDLNIVYVGKGNTALERTIQVIFGKKNIQSTLKIKAIVFDNSKLDLNVLVKIKKGASGCNVYLKIDCLMVGEKAFAKIVPSLEINENEIKAGHGATIGYFDEASLNYLQGKGLDKDSSENLLIVSFLHR